METALQIAQCIVEGMGVIVHEYQQSCQHYVTDHLLQGGKFHANNRLGLPDKFIQSGCILCFDAGTPEWHSKEDDAR